MHRCGLRDDQWERIKDFLPGREGHVGAPRRTIDLPERFGDWKSTHERFRRWCESGVFARVFKILAEDRDNEYMMIGATIVRAHQHSAGARKKGVACQAIGRSRGGLTTRIHVIVDALGNSVAISLTPGQASDLAQAEPLLDLVEPDALLADKAYDANALIDTLEERGITPVIPPKANRTVQRHTDFALYRERNLVERFFGKLKAFPLSQRDTTSSPAYSSPLYSSSYGLWHPSRRDQVGNLRKLHEACSGPIENLAKAQRRIRQ